MVGFTTETEVPPFPFLPPKVAIVSMKASKNPVTSALVWVCTTTFGGLQHEAGSFVWSLFVRLSFVHIMYKVERQAGKGW